MINPYSMRRMLNLPIFLTFQSLNRFDIKMDSLIILFALWLNSCVKLRFHPSPSSSLQLHFQRISRSNVSLPEKISLEASSSSILTAFNALCFSSRAIRFLQNFFVPTFTNYPHKHCGGRAPCLQTLECKNNFVRNNHHHDRTQRTLMILIPKRQKIIRANLVFNLEI